jgi:hypothetical protein
MASLSNSPHIDKQATDARQGRRGRHAFWILAISTILAGSAVFAVWMYHSPGLHSVPQPVASPQDGHSYPGKAYPGHQI